jgi:hypothetical protein
MAVCSEVYYPPQLSPVFTPTNDMTCIEFFGFVRGPSQQRPLPALPCKDTCGTTPTHVLKKQSHASAVVTDTRGPGAMDSVSHSSSSLHLLELLTHVDAT